MFPSLTSYVALVLSLLALGLGACHPADTTAGRAATSTDVPEALGWVSDHAGLLQPADLDRLEQLLLDFERETGNEFAVLLVASTNGEAIEAYSLRVAREWQIGKPGFGNGLLIVVASEDQKVRIEVADGLSAQSISDSVAKDVIDRHFLPAFADEAWGDGLYRGIQALIQATEET